MKIAPVCLALALAPLAGWAQDDGEGEAGETWREAEYTLPARPDERKLRAFNVDTHPAGRFLLDSASLSIGKDGVVRYVLVTRGGAGTSVTTFEGIRCDTGESRLYASLERDGSWRTLGNSVWRALASGRSSNIFGYSGNDPRATLANDYLCDGGAPARTPEEILARLRGKHIDFTDPIRGTAP
ncbi:MAG: CNP1-like family protein [Azoarcus sp.]|jgi:hypothetical protein|nr:CNP1-like family protein [Azoarcus sp.]